MEASNEQLGTTVQALLAQVSELSGQLEQLRARMGEAGPISPSTPEEQKETPNPVTPATSTIPAKSEKLPDPPMFGGIRKELRPFVTKLRLKLSVNADRFPTEQDKLSYAMSRLDGDAARTIDPFFRNGSLMGLHGFISFLEQTYDDASRKHTAITKLENLRQKNREFTVFFSEFLGLVGELDWNESAKVAALRRAISDEIRDRLVGRNLPGTVGELATMCQQIDEDLRFNRAAQSLKPRSTVTISSTRPATSSAAVAAPRPPTSNPRTEPPRPQPVHDPMDLDTTSLRSYAPAQSNERKIRFTKGECFGCGQRGHIQRDCPIRPFEKVRVQSPQGVPLPRSVAQPPRSRVTQYDSDLSDEESENGSPRD